MFYLVPLSWLGIKLSLPLLTIELGMRLAYHLMAHYYED
jgi:hypothetical protein